jgi:hypothetical protein
MILYGVFWIKEIKSLFDFISLILLGYGHLWYIAAMIPAAVLLYLFLNSKVYIDLLFAFLIFGMGIMLELSQLQLVNIFGDFSLITENVVYRNFMFMGLPFMLLGTAIKKLEPKLVSIHTRWLIISTLFFVTMLGIEMVYLHFGERKELDIPIVSFVLCPLVFLSVKRLEVSSPNSSIGKMSSGIYFVHLALVSIIQKLWQVNSIELTIVVFCVSLGLSFILEKLNQRFPYFL